MVDSSEECGFFKEEKNEEELEKSITEEQNITIPLENNLKCKYCTSIPIDKEFFYTFNIPICKNCKFKNIQMITKSTCTKDYLLTQEEVNLFKFITRPNPHKGNWSDMHLYIKNEIEEFSFKKYGSKEELEKTKQKRKEDLLTRKKRKIKKKIKELNKKTFVEKQHEIKHKHNFINKNGKSICDCGMEIEEEEI